MSAEAELQRAHGWRRRVLLVAGVVLAGGFLAYSSCASGQDAPARSPETSKSDTLPSRVSPATPAKLAPATAVDAGAMPIPTGGAGGISPVTPVTADYLQLPSRPVLDVPSSPGSGGSSARNLAIPHVDPRELSLLADIERDLKRDPPPEAHSLIAEFRHGAKRSALIEYVRQRFPKDLGLRVVALRWIDRVRPAPDGTGRPSPHVQMGGGGASWVAPIRKRE
jgi:hypothetical protein